MLRLTLLSHAPTASERLFRFPVDEEIEPLGADRAEKLLAAVGDVDRVLSGPERRNLETVAALGLVATSCEQLRAWSVGVWSGRTLDWIAEHDPLGLHAWQVDAAAAPDGGESLNDLLGRVARWTEAQTAASGRCLVIADSAVLRSIVVHVLAAPATSFWRFDVPPMSVSVVQHAGDQWRLRSLALLPRQTDTLGQAST
jgi:broad specificity phosphatase PhoE